MVILLQIKGFRADYRSPCNQKGSDHANVGNASGISMKSQDLDNSPRNQERKAKHHWT
jgi:hypothetical protein